MIENNRLEKTFGPSGSFAGIAIIVFGVVLTFMNLLGFIVIIVGVFFAFTSTSASIDLDKKRIRFSNDFFGFIKTGEWIDLEPEMKVVIKKSDEVWRSYSRTNQVLDIESSDYLLLLKNADNSEIMTIKKANSLSKAKSEQLRLVKEMGLLG